jgi:hypothetical protein
LVYKSLKNQSIQGEVEISPLVVLFFDIWLISYYLIYMAKKITKELLIKEADFFLKLSGDIEKFTGKAFGEDFPFEVLEAREGFGLGVDLIIEQFKSMKLQSLRLHAELLKQAHGW